jgi:hypothetical protein
MLASVVLWRWLWPTLKATGITGRVCSAGVCTAGEPAGDVGAATGAVGGSRCPPCGRDRTGTRAGVIAGTGVIVDSSADGSCGLRFHMIAKLKENVTTIVTTMERL